jgi:hypothetical protein
MSEAANLQRERAQHWAEPGSRHDKLVGTLKIALPAAVGVVAAIFLTLPLTDSQEVSFILDKKDVGRAEERMKIEAARYSGTDNEGQPSCSMRSGRCSRPATFRWSTSTAFARGLALPKGRRPSRRCAAATTSTVSRWQ